MPRLSVAKEARVPRCLKNTELKYFRLFKIEQFGKSRVGTAAAPVSEEVPGTNSDRRPTAAMGGRRRFRSQSLSRAVQDLVFPGDGDTSVNGRSPTREEAADLQRAPRRRPLVSLASTMCGRATAPLGLAATGWFKQASSSNTRSRCNFRSCRRSGRSCGTCSGCA
jgi:hypothetical protein